MYTHIYIYRCIHIYIYIYIHTYTDTDTHYMFMYLILFGGHTRIAIRILHHGRPTISIDGATPLSLDGLFLFLMEHPTETGIINWDYFSGGGEW